MSTPRFTAWCPELRAALAEPFPREAHTNKGSKGTFVSVHLYHARLNELVGVDGWSMPAPLTYRAGEKLGMVVGVTVLGVTKWNVGDEMEDHGEPIEYTDPQSGEVREKVVDYGSSSTNSWAQAFKRCMAYGFGMGLYLYDKSLTKAIMAGRIQPSPLLPVERVSDEQLRTLSDLIEVTETNRDALLAHYGLATLADMPVARYADAVAKLERKRVVTPA